jgi:hypothetical protein
MEIVVIGWQSLRDPGFDCISLAAQFMWGCGGDGREELRLYLGERWGGRCGSGGAGQWGTCMQSWAWAVRRKKLMGGVGVSAGEKEEGGYRFGVRGNWVVGRFPAWAEALPRGRFHFFVSSFLLFLFCFLF